MRYEVWWTYFWTVAKDVDFLHRPSLNNNANWQTVVARCGDDDFVGVGTNVAWAKLQAAVQLVDAYDYWKPGGKYPWFDGWFLDDLGTLAEKIQLSDARTAESILEEEGIAIVPMTYREALNAFENASQDKEESYDEF